MRAVQSVRRLSNESGYMVVVLPLVFLLLVIAVCTARVTWSMSAAGALKGATEFAVKAAANQYKLKKNSVAIDFDAARLAFEKLLSENLELDSSLNPERSSAFADRPDYTLIVYNGRESDGQPPGVEYTFIDGVLTETEIERTGFPQTFFLSDGTEVVLDSPGAVAEVSVKPKRLFGEMDSYRCWSSAAVVKTKYGWKVVLGGANR